MTMMLAKTSFAVCRVWTALSLHALSMGTSILSVDGYHVSRPPSTTRPFFASATALQAVKPPDFTIIDDDGESSSYSDEKPPEKKRVARPARVQKSSSRRTVPNKPSEGASWMQRNAAFTNSPEEPSPENESNRSFRQDFRGTRVFVQNLPPRASWQDLKDHFRVAGEVVFASVSTDSRTGQSKGVGVVQYETTEMALKAIKIMRDHPMDGSQLYVREDVQERRDTSQSYRGRQSAPPSTWKCANEENAQSLDPSERETILSLVKDRDDARRRKKYDISDQIREQLKFNYNVHVDDRLKLWWTAVDGNQVPEKIAQMKGDGRWGKQKEWRQIPTTPENDACVNSDLVNGLLKQRDIARREKDFQTADSLLEEARTSPDGDLNLRIHDESRTWRIWTDVRPPRAQGPSAAEQCLAIVEEFDPQKLDEMETILEKFPGREYNILKKLKQRYNL